MKTKYNIQDAEELHKHLSRYHHSQVMLVVTVCLVGASVGMAVGHTAVLLPQLQSTNSSIQIDEDAGSWFASLYTLMSPVGCLCGGVAMDLWGRRKLGILGNVGIVLGWVVIASAQDITMLLIGRIIEGFTRGIEATALMVLIDELSYPKYRGSIVCSSLATFSVGILIMSGLGALVHWRIASAIAGGVCALSLITFTLLPETPAWLVRKNRIEEAERALKWLWGPGHELQATKELQQLIARLQLQEHEKQLDSRDATKKMQYFVHLCRNFFRPQMLKPFLISHFFNTIQAFCGLTLSTYYTVDILSKIKRTELDGPDEYLANVLVSAVRFVATTATVLLLFRLPRRPIAMISGLGSFISALSIAVILIIQTSGDTYLIPTNIEAWIHFSLIVLFSGSNSLGLAIIPAVTMGELQPAHIRSFVCGYIFTVNDLVMAGVIKLYPMILRSIGLYGLFLLFAISCLVSTIFVFLFLPETKDKSLLEIEDYFKQRNVLWITRKKCESNFTNNN